MSSTLSTLEVLQKARELISDPKRWTKEEYARDDKGRKVGPNSRHAVCFCSLGAIAKAGRMAPNWVAGTGPAALLRQGVSIVDPKSRLIHFFNDTHTHAEVLAAFDAAISKAIAEGETA